MDEHRIEVEAAVLKKIEMERIETLIEEIHERKWDVMENLQAVAFADFILSELYGLVSDMEFRAHDIVSNNLDSTSGLLE